MSTDASTSDPSTSTIPLPVLFTGGCACGHTTLQGTKAPFTTTNCHCEKCRTDTRPRAPYITFHTFPSESITLLPGDHTTASSDIATRGYCKECEAPLYMQYHARKFRMSIASTTVDLKSWKDGEVPKEMKPAEHIFLKEKDPDFVIPEDGLARYPEFPDRLGPGKTWAEW